MEQKFKLSDLEFQIECPSKGLSSPVYVYPYLVHIEPEIGFLTVNGDPFSISVFLDRMRYHYSKIWSVELSAVTVEVKSC